MSHPDPSDSLGSKLNGITWALTLTAGTFLALRVYCRYFRHRRLWWDDYLLICAWLLQVFHNIMYSICISKGWGRHTDSIPVENLDTIAKVRAVGNTVGILAASLSKTSFAVTLLRITEDWMKKTVWGLILSLNAIDFSFIFLSFARCYYPVTATFGGPRCLSASTFVNLGIFVTAYSAMVDFILAFLPSKVIAHLHMRPHEKMGLAAAMGLGVVAGAAAIIRATQLPKVVQPDYSYNGSSIIIWSVAESSTIIMAASIPAMRAMLVEMKASSRPYYRHADSEGPWPGNGKMLLGVAGAVHRLMTNNIVTIEAAPRRPEKSKDADSVRRGLGLGLGIGGLGSMDALGGIVKTHEVMIDFQDRQDLDFGYDLEAMDGHGLS